MDKGTWIKKSDTQYEHYRGFGTVQQGKDKMWWGSSDLFPTGGPFNSLIDVIMYCNIQLGKQ